MANDIRCKCNNEICNREIITLFNTSNEWYSTNLDILKVLEEQMKFEYDAEKMKILYLKKQYVKNIINSVKHAIEFLVRHVTQYHNMPILGNFAAIICNHLLMLIKFRSLQKMIKKNRNCYYH